jgi:hypothetical protein
MGQHGGRKDWRDVREDVMRRALRAKFTQHDALRAFLLATGDDELVEDADWDSFWGNGPDGKGDNVLGKMLVELREDLRGEGDVASDDESGGC